MTAQLSCHVQKFVMIVLKFQSNLDTDGKIVSELDPRGKLGECTH